MTNETILDLDNMMDMAMDSVEAAPDFCNPPAGDYSLKVQDVKTEKYTPKVEAGKPEPAKDSAARIRITYAVTKTIATKEMPVADGSLFSESFMYTEKGISYFKRQAMNILNVKDFTGATLKDVIDGLKDAEFNAKISVRLTANPAGGNYENVNVRPVHTTPAA